MTLDAFATPLDLAALVYFLLAIGIYRLIAGARALERRSLVGAIQEQRVRWMLNMAKRDNRMLDAILLGRLGQGNAFFASTSAIAVGGLAATLGSGEKMQALLMNLPFVAPATPFVWETEATADHEHIHLRILQVRVGIPTVALRLDHDRRHPPDRRTARNAPTTPSALRA